MKTYIGTKFIKATPMTRTEFCKHHFEIKSAKDYSDDGYLVEYADGYKSWSPKSVFENAYREVTEEEKKLVNS